MNELPKLRAGRFLGSIRPELLRFFVGGVLSLISVGTWIYVVSTTDSPPIPTIFLATFPLSVGYAVLFGWRIALAVLAISAVLGWYLILPPELSFTISDPSHPWYVAGILIASVVISILVGGGRSSPRNTPPRN